jgi:hypothetical protein
MDGGSPSQLVDPKCWTLVHFDMRKSDWTVRGREKMDGKEKEMLRWKNEFRSE